MQWSEQQKKVIQQRNSDILVSAAAGSGKTAVLVERIIDRICDSQNPIDIDRILIVTFTRAAAREMKERIYKTLEQRISQDPTDPHLMAQTTLIHNARISTIDGFCQYLVRNYFHEIGLDPMMRIAEEGELVLLQNEVIESLFEEKYDEGDENFLFLVDAFAKKERDDAVVQMVMSLYRESCSYPYPVSWLEKQRELYTISDERKMAGSLWMQTLTSHVRMIIKDLLQETEQLLDDLNSGQEPHPYAQAVSSDRELIKSLLLCSDYPSLLEVFSNLSFAVLSRKKLPGEEKEEREKLKVRRDEIKKTLTEIRDELVWQPVEEMIRDFSITAAHVNTLIDLTVAFGERYGKEKADRGLMDFSDLEHYALSILVDEKTRERTASAKQLSEYFSEVMVDEYQDSNYLQEMILSSITRDQEGQHDFFMVGDVKQSIYRFRQARPDIFLQKYNDFQKKGQNEVLIGLEKNFRSRQEVTDSVNSVFEAVMVQDMGGITYDKSQALVCGATTYPTPEDEHTFLTEILVSDTKQAKEAGFENKNQYEATIIAYQINALLKHGSVTDKETSLLRPIRLSDIVILHRNANTVGKTYQDTLKGYGIESRIVSVTGYFSAREVETVLSLLRVLNNPLGDIELAAVMKSELFSFSDAMLADIRARFPKIPFHKAVLHFIQETEDGKAKKFWMDIRRWRSLVKTCSIYELLSIIFEETDYLAYISAMPGGRSRRSNIEKLLQLSITYENSSYKGLFYFVRYIERLQKYEQDMGQASVLGVQEAVSIMTIHKSKGLEFPIVFLAGCGQRFRSHSGAMVLHPDMGMGLYAVDIENRTKKNTLYRRFLLRMNLLEERGEELRVLYVAMTRAKEKLILVAVDNDIEKSLGKQPSVDGRMSLHRRLHAKHYLDYILSGTHRYPGLFSIKAVTMGDLVMNEVKEQIKGSQKKQALIAAVDSVSEEMKQSRKDNHQFVYPHPIQSETKVKYSVSEIKRRAMTEAFADEDMNNIFETTEKLRCIPWFITRQDKPCSPAERGTAVHRYLECFDFAEEDYLHSYDKQKQRMVEKGLLKIQEAELLIEKEILLFLRSELAQRMHLAAKQGTLEKEAAFVMMDKPSFFFGDTECDQEEPILVQGIIDVFFEEEDGIVLVDYKTDRIRSGDELMKRYKKQMMLYAEALERTKDKEIKAIILYAFALGRAIMVK